MIRKDGIKILIRLCHPCQWVVVAIFMCLSATFARGAEPNDKSATPAHRLGLRTNMLSDAMGVPDIGAEYYVGGNVSVTGHWMYAWWGTPRHHHLWRIYGGDIGARYWLGTRGKPLTGHHIGIYAGMLTFDFQFGGKGYMAGRPGHSIWDRLWINAGVEYGYALPITRCLNIDFAIGVGYMGGKMEKYTPKNGVNTWEATVKKSWIGPTKAEVTLVWLIDWGKGDRR